MPTTTRKRSLSRLLVKDSGSIRSHPSSTRSISPIEHTPSSMPKQARLGTPTLVAPEGANQTTSLNARDATEQNFPPAQTLIQTDAFIHSNPVSTDMHERATSPLITRPSVSLREIRNLQSILEKVKLKHFKTFQPNTFLNRVYWFYWKLLWMETNFCCRLHITLHTKP